MRLTWPSLLSGSVFLLFPLAHLRLIQTFPIYAAELPLLLLLVGWGLALIARRESLGVLIARSPVLFIGSLTFLIGAGIAFFANELPWHTLGLVKSFLILPVLFAWWLATRSFTPGEYWLVLFLWFLGVVAAALGGLINAGLGFFTYDGRLASLFSSPNHFAMLLAPGLILGFAFSYITPPLLGCPWLRAATLIILGALFLTRSYGVLVATLGALFVLALPLLREAHRLALGVLVAVVLFFAIGVAIEWPSDKFQAFLDFDSRSSLASRLMIWTAALDIGAESFPWGIGSGQFQTAYLAAQPLYPPYLEWAVPEPHNLLMSIYLSTGLIGLLGLVGVSLFFLVCLIRFARSSVEPHKKSLAGLLAALLVWYALVGLLDTPYWKSDLALGLWGLIGLSVALLSSPKD